VETGWTQEILNWLNANPGWGFAFVFLVAMLESLVLIGILLPGIVIIFGVGALIGLGVLELLPIWVAASLGAFAGDALSYALGRRFRDHLMDIWPFSRYPLLMERGRGFFTAHGAKSVVAGRFIGPLRPIIPAVAGTMGMAPGRFLVVDIPACITWAPAFLLPGMLFGASLEVASEYTGRLTVLLIILLVVLWFTWWLSRLVYEPLAMQSARWMRHAIRWNRRHPVLGRITGQLIDPAHPEALSISMLGVLLVLMFWGLVMLLFLTPFSSQPQALDQAVQELALSLRNHLADPVMVAIAQISRWPVSVISAAALLLWLAGAGRRNASLHWLIAIGGGALLHWMLSWSLRATPQMFEMGEQVLRGPSAAMSLPTVVLTFFAVMVAADLKRKHRQWPYTVAALILILLTLARLYLGLEWLSGALMGIALGLAWTAIVGIAYRQRSKRSSSGAIASLIFYGSFALLFAWQAGDRVPRDLADLRSPVVERSIAQQDWWDGGWAGLPANRTRVVSGSSSRFNAQVAVDAESFTAALAAAGWAAVEETDWRWLVQSLNPDPDETNLPLISRLFEGREEVVLMRRSDASGLLTIRLWDSGLRLEPGARPVLLGQLSREVIRQRLGIFSYWSSQPAEAPAVQQVLGALSGLDSQRVSDELMLFRLEAR
jgi:membrane protein DedA with SNARE-associated domain